MNSFYERGTNGSVYLSAVLAKQQCLSPKWYAKAKPLLDMDDGTCICNFRLRPSSRPHCVNLSVKID